jgi:hypothetical protein
MAQRQLLERPAEIRETHEVFGRRGRHRPLRGEPGRHPDGAPQPPPRVDRDPEGHAPDPGLGQVVAAEPVPAGQRARERVLCHVLGLDPVADHRRDQRHQQCTHQDAPGLASAVTIK